MPEKPAQEKTEAPTEKRIADAKKEGQLAESQEVPTAMTLGMLLVVLTFTVSGLVHWLYEQVHSGVSYRRSDALTDGALQAVLHDKADQCLAHLAPFVIAGMVVSLLASLVTGGWAVTPKNVGLKFSRINPINGLKNMFSLKSFQKLLVSLAKLAVLSIIVYLFIQDKAAEILKLMHLEAWDMLVRTSRLVLSLTVRCTLALVVIALADLLFQKWKYKRDLRMTKQELKEEHKQYEVSGELKGRRRAIQMEMSRKRMLTDVPQADVVVTNPTHVAVAVKYDKETMDAPMVLAKGADLLATRIREIAVEHDVAIVERPPLARTLYATCEVGQAIPDTLFVAVAEVLAMIFRMRRKRRETGKLVAES